MGYEKRSGGGILEIGSIGFVFENFVHSQFSKKIIYILYPPKSTRYDNHTKNPPLKPCGRIGTWCIPVGKV